MIKFVGVGPGDPELITYKAVHAIEQADLIAMADSERGNSVVLTITERWIHGKPILRLPMPMQGSRTDWETAHQSAADQLMTYLGQGKKLAYLVLGDPSLYATSSYLLRKIAPHFPCEIISGIPSICAAAAALQVPLCEGREKLTILPGYDAEKGMPNGNIIIMKAGKSLNSLKEALQGREAYLVQNLGMAQERVCALSDAVIDDPEVHQSYFSTIIVKG